MCNIIIVKADIDNSGTSAIDSSKLVDPTDFILSPLMNIKLTGIATSEHSVYCMINNQVLTLGDTINGLTVYHIEPDKVLLKSGDDKIFELFIQPQDAN